jgi:very-short-patch-repair endonuclease
MLTRKPRTPDYVIDLARKMRSDMTPEEAVLWERLRKNRLDGLRFRRQRPIGRYVVDFYCAEALLAVELDGGSHLGREEYDGNRDAFLSAGGYAVLRFSNDDIHTRIGFVLDAIRHTALERINRPAT